MQDDVFGLRGGFVKVRRVELRAVSCPDQMLSGDSHDLTNG